MYSHVPAVMQVACLRRLLRGGARMLRVPRPATGESKPFNFFEKWGAATLRPGADGRSPLRGWVV
jgi:uncharacterized protein YdaL